jgi:signal transduction histidine kinase
MKLHEFLATHRDMLIARAVLYLRPATPGRTDAEVEGRLAGLVDQIVYALRRDAGAPDETVLPGHSMLAAEHGRERYARGFDVLSVVRDFGMLSNTLGELATKAEETFEPREYQVFNQCIDSLTLAALDEYSRQAQSSTEARTSDVLENVLHELRAELSTGRMAFRALQSGTLGIRSRTADLVDRSFGRIERLLRKAAVVVRLRTPEVLGSEQLDVASELRALVGAAPLERQITIGLDVEPGLMLVGDPGLIMSATSNLIENAVSYSKAGARVQVRARRDTDVVIIEVEDQCGGLGKTDDDLYLPFVQRSGNRRGPGLGLAIAQEAVTAHGGEVAIQNRPGEGCTMQLRFPHRGR